MIPTAKKSGNSELNYRKRTKGQGQSKAMVERYLTCCVRKTRPCVAWEEILNQLKNLQKLKKNEAFKPVISRPVNAYMHVDDGDNMRHGVIMTNDIL
jgi:hypothetical protein